MTAFGFVGSIRFFFSFFDVFLIVFLAFLAFLLFFHVFGVFVGMFDRCSSCLEPL